MIAVKDFLMSLLSFGRMDLPPEAYSFGKTLEFVRYENGNEISKEIFDQQNPKYQSMTTCLESNRGKWKYDIVSYAPSVLIKGNGITLNCRKTNAVIHYMDVSGNPIQLSSNVSSIPHCGIE